MSIYDKEGLAIQKSLIHFREIIGPAKVKIETDNKNLIFQSMEGTKIKKLKKTLNLFNYELKFIPGNLNFGPDYLSRVKAKEECKILEAHNSVISKKFKLTSVKQFSTKWKSKGEDVGSLLKIKDKDVQRFLEEFHHIFDHLGSTKTKTTLKGYFTFNNFNKKIELFNKNCVNCARNKRSQVQHGLLSEFYWTANQKNMFLLIFTVPLCLKQTIKI